ncbi:MAG: hypothetical protein FWG77_02395 [Treponema sp.]|nr:hypothetical protein [Treponema sp.]
MPDNVKSRTLLYILLGTFLNVVLILFCFIIFLVIYSVFLHSRLPENGIAWVLSILFIAALGISLVLYRLIMKRLIKKFPKLNIV